MERMTEPTDRSGVDRDVDALLEADEQRDPALPHARRDTLDLQEQEIKDAVLRMGALVEEAIRRAASALQRTTRPWPSMSSSPTAASTTRSVRSPA